MEVRDIDCLYEACPIPILKAIKELRTMNSGDILVLHSDQSCIGVMVEEWGDQNNYPIRVLETENGEWEIYIQKT
ncbi:sulfurtransferase TusA family protein [Clostridium sp. CF012]|uniref:sulfurtransferase TusA family protein n=1 Tax=Clostridium sp. CF012 TaxID=2843319 RepID=UPI001C0B76FE|nr:sulfurtransferase TusA family protein [Clostridium sp. CF012]MBU3142915.1 sulfurtransferase TusA family protein [Clostridium sp. CF012]